MDESGDFTKGVGLRDTDVKRVLGFLVAGAGIPYDEFMASIGGDPVYRGSVHSSWVREWGTRIRSHRVSSERALVELRQHFGDNRVFVEGLSELAMIVELARASNYSEDQIRFDSSVVRGLEYYTGPVYEVELTFGTEDERGHPVRFGSVGGGGRYDGLVARFGGEPVPATGFSIGVSRLQAALTHLGELNDRPQSGPVIVLVMDRDHIITYQRMVQTLRNAKLVEDKPNSPNIRAELYLGSSGMRAQMKYADKRGAPCVVIQGSDERNHPTRPHVIIKELTGDPTAAERTVSRDEWRMGRQFAVPEENLVDAVREVLARHCVTWD
jgi:histidyl-tRNA synthetase